MLAVADCRKGFYELESSRAHLKVQETGWLSKEKLL